MDKDCCGFMGRSDFTFVCVCVCVMCHTLPGPSHAAFNAAVEISQEEVERTDRGV